MITVDFKDRRPIYVQIVENVKLLIANGAICENEKLPSVRSLSMELGINPNTIQRAYSELERQEIIITVQGKGVFVAAAADGIASERRAKALEKAKEALIEAKAAGIDLEALKNQLEEIFANGGENK